jgi:sec-independent protein translocase protein TatC
VEREPQSIQEHIDEFRSRLIYSAAVFTLFSIIGFYFSGEVLAFLQADVGVQLNALAAYEAIYTQIMIGVLLGFVSGLPFFIYQGLKFAEPGLKPKEYRVLRNFLPVSFALFLLGSAFSYEFVVKNSFRFFESTTEAAEVMAVWGLKNTIGFALKLSFLSGLLFQLPVVSVVLARVGLLNSDQMRKYRVYFIVAVLLLSALATPPDIVTQVLVTAPVILLYQLSIYLVSRIE